MKFHKIILAIAIIATFFLTSAYVSAAESDGIIASGTSGTSEWVIDDDGVLTITAGEMEDWVSLPPWYEYHDQIKTVKTTGQVKLATASRMFNFCENIVTLDLSGFDFTDVSDMNYMFSNCTSLVDVNTSVINAPKINNIGGMFANCVEMKSIDVSSLTTSNVTDMSCLFYNCKSLETLDLSGFETSKVIYMYSMFDRCHSLKSLDISSFDTSSATKMGQMFAGCNALESLDVSKFDTSKVTEMSEMFSGCSSLTSLDLSRFDTSKVTNMSYMFASVNVQVLDLSSLNTSNVENMRYMFAGVSSSVLDISGFDTTNVKNMSGMFYACKVPSLDLSSLMIPDDADLTDMFYGIKKLKTGNWEGTENRPPLPDSMTDTDTMIRYEKNEMFPPVNGHTFVLSDVSTGGYTITDVTLNKSTIEWGEELEVTVHYEGSEPVRRASFDFLHTEFYNRDPTPHGPTGYAGFAIGDRNIAAKNVSFNSATGKGTVTVTTTISCFDQIGLFNTCRFHLYGDHSIEDILDSAEILDLYPLEVKAPDKDASFEMYYCDERLYDALDNLREGDSAIILCERIDDDMIPAEKRVENYRGLTYTLVTSELYNAIKGRDITLLIPTYSTSYVEINGKDVGDNVEDIYFVDYDNTCVRCSRNDDGSPDIVVFQSFPNNGELPSKTVYRFLKTKWYSAIMSAMEHSELDWDKEFIEGFLNDSLLYYLINNQSAVEDGRYALDGLWIAMTLDHNSDYAVTNSDPRKIKTFNAGLSQKTFVYNGKIQKPKIFLDIVEGHGKKKEHSITYSNKKSREIGSYKIKIKAPKSGHGSHTLTYTIKPPKVTGVKLRSPKSRQMEVSYAKKSGGVKYQIRYRAKGARSWKTTTATRTYKLLKNLKGGASYQVEVRAYKIVSGSGYYGEWTKVKTCKVKK